MDYQKKKFYKKDDKEYDPETVELYKAYAGSGNPDAPQEILTQMKRLAGELEGFGYTLRVGGLNGPEEAFEAGTDKVELHLPWRDFNQKVSKLTFNSKEAQAIAAKFHPAYDGLKPAIQAFLAKNVRMLLGNNLKSPALFLICWSEDGAENSRQKTMKTGNVGHAISIASAMHIPVFNLKRDDAEQRLRQHLGLPQKQSLTEI